MLATQTPPSNDTRAPAPLEALVQVGNRLGGASQPDYQGACEALSQYFGGWAALDIYDAEDCVTRRADAYRGKAIQGPLPPLDAQYIPVSLQPLTEPRILEMPNLSAGWVFRPGWRDLSRPSKRAAVWVAPLSRAGRLLGILSLSVPSVSAVTAAGIEPLTRLFAFAAETERLEREAARVRSMRDEMLSVVSHDLKNPLTAMLVSASLLEERAARMSGEQGGRFTKLSTSIRRSAERMNGMLSDLLDIVRIEAGRLTYESRPADLVALFDDACKSVAAFAEQRGAAIEIVAKPAHAVWIAGDRERLLRVLVNLLTCALQAAPAGTKATAAIELESGGAEVRLVITDLGDTLNEEQRKSIFSALWRTPDQPKGPGGLSLTASKGIVEHHGGRLEHVPLQHGNRLVCRLPVCLPPSPA